MATYTSALNGQTYPGYILHFSTVASGSLTGSYDLDIRVNTANTGDLTDDQVTALETYLTALVENLATQTGVYEWLGEPKLTKVTEDITALYTGTEP